MIAAGPCLAAVLCIWLIGAMITELEGKTLIAAFRALVIYSFALSFVITAPIALVSTRLISDKLHDRDVTAVSGIMLATYALTTVVVLAAGAPLFGLLLDLETTASVAAVANCVLIALVWVACLFCSVTRDYNSVTGYFAAGMLVDQFAWHLPLYRQHQRLEASGIRVSRPWLTQVTQRSIQLLAPIYEAQLASIRASRLKSMD